MSACNNSSNVLQQRLKTFPMNSFDAVKHSNARALGRFPRWSQCMSLRVGGALHAFTCKHSLLELMIAQLRLCETTLECMNCDAKRQGIEGIVSVLHQKEGNREIHPRRPRDFLRPKSFRG